jgi:glutaconate CoA-transferase subunit A
VHANLVGLQAFGMAPNFRRKVEINDVQFVEHSEFSLVVALKAAGMRVPFLPTKAVLNSDLVRANHWKVFRCPITDEQLCAIPALKLDVAIIHVPQSDEKGNAHIEGAVGLDQELVVAADNVILTTERIVSTREIMKQPYKTRIFSHCVGAVVEIPRGAYPTSCFPFYRLDGLHLLNYAENASSPDWVQRYLSEGRES